MGFVAGLGVPTGMGVPTYYIDDGGNQWDANTYATVIFDGSGSMSDVITGLTAAMGGDYFSSGSASGGDGVKNVESIRSTVQDYYATGGIEGAPTFNTNNATNGHNEFEKHVQMITLSESSAEYMGTPYSHNSSATWPASPVANAGWKSANFITPSNFIQIVVCNESNDEYQDHIANGSEWANTEITDSWKEDMSATKTLLGDTGYSANGVSSSTQAGTRADSANPSFTLILIDPGINGVTSDPYANGFDGPDLGYGFGSTSSMRLWVQGALHGEGVYGLDAITNDYNYSFNDLDTVTAWNGKENMLIVECLYVDDDGALASENSDPAFWKVQLEDAISQNLSI